MNKNRVDTLIPDAYAILDKVGIVENGQIIDKWWSGQISAFGASITQGSLIASVSFFRKDDKRIKLMNAIEQLLGIETSLLEHLQGSNKKRIKEEIMSAAVALKLSMNLYERKESSENVKNTESAENEP